MDMKEDNEKARKMLEAEVGPVVDKATPRPWETVGATRIWKTGKVGAAVAIIAEPECENSNDFQEVSVTSPRWGEAMANAELIVRAVNAYSALEVMKIALRRIAEHPHNSYENTSRIDVTDGHRCAAQIAITALALVETNKDSMEKN